MAWIYLNVSTHCVTAKSKNKVAKIAKIVS